MLPDNRQFSLALDALAELKAEIQTLQPGPLPAAPALTDVLRGLGALPREALFLGMASDGLPVLLNLHDPVPGPVLIVGDAGAGKTAFLKNIARVVALTHAPSEVKFGVISSHLDEWQEIQDSSHCLGIFSSHNSSGQDFLTSMASWAHTNTRAGPSMLLLIDDLEAVAALDFNALQTLRWLLARGPSRRAWAFVTMNAARYGRVISWIPNFRTRIFGRITDARVATAVGGDEASALGSLLGGAQFSLRENGSWLRFWLPSS
ncbi:MAG: NACHT domain-containing protein [Anaerolineales bacterium]|nr:NACHT domain-containing protein [Anaerolineales bacterium]